MCTDQTSRGEEALEEDEGLPGSGWWGSFTVWNRWMDIWACHLSFDTLQQQQFCCGVVTIYLSFGKADIKKIHGHSVGGGGVWGGGHFRVLTTRSPPLCLCVSPADRLQNAVQQMVGDRVQSHQVPVPGHRVRLLYWSRKQKVWTLVQDGAQIWDGWRDTSSGMTLYSTCSTTGRFLFYT